MSDFLSVVELLFTNCWAFFQLDFPLFDMSIGGVLVAASLIILGFAFLRTLVSKSNDLFPPSSPDRSTHFQRTGGRSSTKIIR